MTKLAYTIADQIALLKQRGMIFKDEAQACNRLQNISYYRLKGYWWDMQNDTTLHLFHSGACFEDVLDRYDFDRKLRPTYFLAGWNLLLISAILLPTTPVCGVALW
jgi:abortive infection bacteriophage resistance protein